tara:strand:- start:277 stop:705 length:429 start_codon:yes stop_codon:yes gene_type:complete
LNTSRAWLAEHSSISIIARDRGGGHGEVVARGLPNALQVADRWHLMENSGRVFFDAVGKSMRQIRQAVGSNVLDPKLLTCAKAAVRGILAPTRDKRGDQRAVDEGNLDPTNRPLDRLQPEGRARCPAPPEVRRFPHKAKFAG